VSGKVTTKEEPNGAPSITVVVKGTTTGTITDIEGNYKISVPNDNAILVFSFVGYKPKEVIVGTQSTVDIALEEDNAQLQEVVVVGYATVKKKDLTGSMSHISEKDLNAGPVTDPLQRISGRAAGVTINQVGSEPGTGPNVRIRGITSLRGGNDPLVIVDGIQGNMDLLNQIPPSEIESFDILKDASATAVYGSRGAAGVILVTTKRAKQGKLTVDYSGVGSFETISKRYEVLDAAQWRAAAAQLGITSGDFNANTNWQDQITRNGFTQTHNLGVGASVAGFNIRTSLTAIGQEGVVINSGMNNYIGRMQVVKKLLKDKLTLTGNINAGYRIRRFNNADVIGTALSRRPTDPVFNPDGSYFVDLNTFGYVNPYARAKEMVDGDKTGNYFGSLRADYEIMNGLTASVFGTWRYTNRVYQQYRSRLTTQADTRDGARAQSEIEDSHERLFNFILNYKKTIGDHSFDASFIYEWQYAMNTRRKVGYRDVPNNPFENGVDLFGNNVQGIRLPYNQDFLQFNDNDQTLVSFVGRLNYSYKDKYLLTATVRTDGSSKFGVNNRYALFPSMSAAWRLSEEAFLKNSTVVSDLKLRAGYGVTGNQQGLDRLGSILLTRQEGQVFFGGQLIDNYRIYQNANPDLRWETRKMYNIGLDFGFFNNRLSGSIDYYNGLTSDLLFDYDVPRPPYPHGSIKANVGSMRNEGVEIGLNYIVIDKQDFRLSLGGNFTRNTNIIEELNGSINGVALNRDYVRWGAGGTTGIASTNNAMQYLIKGQPVGTYYLFKHAGVDAQGNQIIDDLDGNGKIDDGDLSKDRYIAGNALPLFSYAFTPSATYKNWDINIVFRGVYGNDIYNARRASLSALSQLGQGNVVRSAVQDGIRNISYATDYWLEKGSFGRLENLTIGYRFKPQWKFIESLRVSATANNLFIITNYSGIDPEVNGNGGDNDGRGFGTDFGLYPRTRTFALGLNVTFK
jgi:iron complex outermembrane receptor protein